MSYLYRKWGKTTEQFLTMLKIEKREIFGEFFKKYIEDKVVLERSCNILCRYVINFRKKGIFCLNRSKLTYFCL